MIKAAILVPSHEQDKERHVYWNQLLDELKPWDVTGVVEPISKFWGNTGVTFKTWQQYDVIIVTTDTANGSPECGGDKALDYFLNQQARQRLVKWVKSGGILLAEVQSQGGRPWQASYDAIFGSGELRVLVCTKRREAKKAGAGYENVLPHEGGRSSRGSTALVPKRYHAHPVCYGIHPSVISRYSYSGEQIIPPHYREDGESQFSLYYRCPETLYSGWFVDWARDWIPVLVECETAKWPVLLVKIEDKGAWLASTMRLTSKEALPIIRNIVFYRVFGYLWVSYHMQTLQDRRRKDIAEISAVTVLFLMAVGLAVWTIGPQHVLEGLEWLHLIVGLPIFGLAILWARFALLFRRRGMGYPLYKLVGRTLTLFRKHMCPLKRLPLHGHD